jgi:hypothetical protein
VTRRLSALVTALAIVLALAASGCGGDSGPSPREQVASYIAGVNAIQAELDQPSRTVSRETRKLAKPKADRAEIAVKLNRAAQQIDRLRARVAAVTTPAGARKLRALVLERMQRQADLSRELAAYAMFGPAFDTALQPLGAAGAKLRTALTAKTAPAVKAAALDDYAASVDATLVRLRKLHPPAVSAPAYHSQVVALEGVRASAQALAVALRKQDATQIPTLLHRFEVAAVSNRSLAAQRAQIAAVRAYNDEVRRLDTLATRIYNERTRVQKSLE